MTLKIIVFWFVTVSVTVAVGSLIYVFIDWLIEKRKADKPLPSRTSAQAEGGQKGRHALAGALIGVGALSLLGNLVMAHRINKLSDTIEERRKWKR